MHHYISPINNAITLIKTEETIPVGSFYDIDGQACVCMHVPLRRGTYGYLLPVGVAFNRTWAVGQIGLIHPNPLVFDID